jgi:hypothetical protein
VLADFFVEAADLGVSFFAMVGLLRFQVLGSQ